MSGHKPLIYIDACVIISMITGDMPKESAILSGLARMMDSQEIIPVTSALTRSEILECNLTQQQKDRLKRLISPPKMQVKSVDTKVEELAQELRDYYQALKESGQTTLPTLSAPDANHLATAILYECEKFYTYDEKDRPASSGRPQRGLIPLSGNLAGKYTLEICKPDVKQLGLDV
ncbi:MAG: type II toxin-antitoxin system VapC family toxin [Proteobacteria bacterium]|nr:type II toxin-antitoxin system VapC family toxin [Pseudomonadota bacterium]